MTYEVDCRLDNQECVIIEPRFPKLRKLLRLPGIPTCRHKKKLSHKLNLYCRERKLRLPGPNPY